ncbi:MAG TPA: hypothetical protein VNS09_07285 [Solirubrobacter sp.]|nr:hypothetical protein [Solirubrobacter sp.]
MLREQIAGDHELRRDIVDGREPRLSLDDVNARIALVERLAKRVGGLY